MSFLASVFKKKDEPIKSYDDFWAWFQKNEKTFFKVVKKADNIEQNFFDKISPKLNELKEGFFFLTGMYDDNTAELILTPDGKIRNIVFAEELVAAAPKIPGWRFTALKPALEIKDVGINMSGYEFSSETLSFYANELPNYPDEIDIVVVHKHYRGEDKQAITNGVYIFLDNYLGELNFVTTVDNINVVGEREAEKELVPIEKLKAFLIWREKEFMEKYEGERHDTENDTYSTLEMKLKNGTMLVAMVNSTLLEWDRKPSHQWMMTVRVKFDGSKNNGMPDDETYKLLDEFENAIAEELKDSGGYLNIGRETGDNLREIYFACKDFRKPSKVMHELTQNPWGLEVSYDIYKDKYWQAMERYRG